MAYDMVEPGGDPRADLRASVVAHTIATGSLTRKGKKGWALSDFGLVPATGDEPQQKRWKDWRQVKAAMQAALCRPREGA